MHLKGKILRNPNQEYSRICSFWNPNQLLREPIHLKGKILSLQVTWKKNRCLARLCFDIFQVVYQPARFLQGFYCLARNLHNSCTSCFFSTRVSCKILQFLSFLGHFGVFDGQPKKSEHLSKSYRVKLNIHQLISMGETF